MQQHNDVYPERNDSLWILTVAPTIWALHFLLCYCSAAIYCAKAAAIDSDLDPIRIAIAVLSAAALAGIAVTGVFGYRRHRAGTSAEFPLAGGLPHDKDDSGDRHRFIGFATLLLCGVSALATVYVALVAVFFENCR